MSIAVGLVGAGWIGAQHARRLTETVAGARVASVSDLDPARAAAIARDLGAGVAASADALVDDPGVDAVVVASWGPVHAEQVIACVKAGKPVFCEKPLTTDQSDGLRVLQAEQARGRRLVQVGFMRRYDDGYRQLRRLVAAGAVGTPLMAHCAHRNVAARERYTTPMAAQDTAVHEIDTLRWLLDDELVSVQVLTPRATSRRFAHLRDPQILLFETASGVRADVEVFVNCRYGYDVQCEIVGETGAARLPDPAAVAVRRAGEASVRLARDFQDRFAPAFDAELQAWVDSVRSGTEPGGPSAWDGYAATAVTDAAVRAQRSGAVVPVDLPERPSLYT